HAFSDYCRIARSSCSKHSWELNSHKTSGGNMVSYTQISVEHSFQNKIATITLRRPEVHNAFNAQVVEDLMMAFTELSTDEKLHGVVLTGAGPSFSAGADLNLMKAAATFTEEENLNDALRLA